MISVLKMIIDILYINKFWLKIIYFEGSITMWDIRMEQHIQNWDTWMNMNMNMNVQCTYYAEISWLLLFFMHFMSNFCKSTCWKHNTLVLIYISKLKMTNHQTKNGADVRKVNKNLKILYNICFWPKKVMSLLIFFYQFFI